MEKRSELFELIHSLTKTEKRYFKRYASGNIHKGKSNYIRLFDLLENEKVYTDKTVEKLKKEPFYRNLRVTGHFLYKLILKILDILHSDREKHLDTVLHQVNILFQKGLYRHCEKLLRKAKQDAVRYEKFTRLLDIYQWESILFSDEGIPDRMLEYLRRGAKEEEETFRKLFSVKQQKDTLFRLMSLIKTGIKKQDNLIFNKLHRHSFLNRKDSVLKKESILSYSYFLNAKSLYFFINNEWKKSCRYAREYVSLFEKYPDHFSRDFHRYVGALNNYRLVCHGLRNYAEVVRILKKLRDLPSRSRNMEVRLFTRSYLIEISLYAETGEFRKGVSIVSEIEEKISAYEKEVPVNYQLIFLYLFAYMNFGTGQYQTALHYINQIFAHNNFESVHEVAFHARMLDIFIHFELKNFDLLGYKVLSVRRYLSKRKKLFSLEKKFLNFFQHASRNLFSDRTMDSYITLLNNLSKNHKDPYLTKGDYYFDFFSWLRSKISGRSFSSVVSARNKD